MAKERTNELEYMFIKKTSKTEMQREQKNEKDTNLRTAGQLQKL